MKLSTAALCILVSALSLVTSAIVGAQLPGHFPHIHDEYAYLFAGRTFADFRLTNPTPELWRFFESQHLLMHPSMMAKYPAAPGMALAVGYWLGAPIIGIWLSCAGFAAATTWMLRTFFAPRWAVLGGVIAVAQLGLSYYWAQTFWGAGALTAAGGALVFGGACRVWRQPRLADSLLLGLGVAILMHTRPLEGLLACLVPAALVLIRWLHRDGIGSRLALLRLVLPCGAVIAASAAFLAYYNYRVTGSPWRLPYLEYEQQYLGSPAFVWQRAPAHAPAFANPALEDFYREFVQNQIYPTAAIPAVLIARLRMIAVDFIGFALAPFVLLGALWRPTKPIRFALASLAICALPLVFSYYFLPHYEAPAVALTTQCAVAGVRRLFLSLPRRLHRFWLFAAALLALQATSLALDTSNQRLFGPLRNQPRRDKIEATLRASGDRHLIFVRLVPPYYLHDTWVFNFAPLDANPVLWAWDRGPEENRLLMQHYPNRQVLLMTVHDGRITFDPMP